MKNNFKKGDTLIILRNKKKPMYEDTDGLVLGLEPNVDGFTYMVEHFDGTYECYTSKDLDYYSNHYGFIPCVEKAYAPSYSTVSMDDLERMRKGLRK